jgi:hypothetical protein
VPRLPLQPLSLPKVADLATETADREALRNILTGGLGAFGVGAMLRGLKAVPEVVAPQPLTSAGVTDGPTILTINREPQKRQRPLSWIQPAATSYGKRAELTPAPASPTQPGMIEGAANALYDNVLKPAGLPNFDVPGGTTNPISKPWHLPGLVGGMALGGAGGWKLVDWLADKHRHNTQDAELRDAENEYMTAIQGLHAPKTAALDEARQALHKTADPQTGLQGVLDAFRLLPRNLQDAANGVGRATSGLGGLAAMTAIPSGLMAYKYVRDSSDSRALQEALAARQRLVQMRSPSPPQIALEPEPEKVAV